MLAPWTTAARAAGVVVTLPPLAGLVRLLDDGADVRCLLPPGADAHDFQLAPSQADALARASLLVRTSRDDGHWRGLRAVRTLDLWPETDHAWLLPSEVHEALPRLARELERLAPERRPRIETRLARALKQVDDVEAAWRTALAPLIGRGVVMEHPAWRRLAERFGLPVLAVLEPSHHGGVRPRRLEEALTLLRERPGVMLWGDARHANRALAWLSRRAGNRPVLMLDALGACGQSWTELMQANIARVTSFSRHMRHVERQPRQKPLDATGGSQ